MDEFHEKTELMFWLKSSVLVPSEFNNSFYLFSQVSLQNAFSPGHLWQTLYRCLCTGITIQGALDRDYGDFTTYCRPRNPHPDSILW